MLSKALSPHDVEEVLEEQRHAGPDSLPFGQTALELGLCTPAHIWQAWADQLTDPGNPPSVDVEALGIDAQAIAALPHAIATEFGVLPLRLVGGNLILATTADRILAARLELPHRLSVTPRFVIGDEEQISRAIETCYRRLQACA